MGSSIRTPRAAHREALMCNKRPFSKDCFGRSHLFVLFWSGKWLFGVAEVWSVSILNAFPQHFCARRTRNLVGGRSQPKKAQEACYFKVAILGLSWQFPCKCAARIDAGFEERPRTACSCAGETLSRRSARKINASSSLPAFWTAKQSHPIWPSTVKRHINFKQMRRILSFR